MTDYYFKKGDKLKVRNNRRKYVGPSAIGRIFTCERDVVTGDNDVRTNDGYFSIINMEVVGYKSRNVLEILNDKT